MELAGRAQLSTAQAMEFLRQSVQRAGGAPSEGAQRIGEALQQRLQAEQPQSQPRQAPGQDGPGANQQQGGIFGLFKAIGDFFLSLLGLGGNQQPQQQQQPAPGPLTEQHRPPRRA